MSIVYSLFHWGVHIALLILYLELVCVSLAACRLLYIFQYQSYIEKPFAATMIYNKDSLQMALGSR